MWIAGGGEKKTLRIAAQYADYTNFAPSAFEEKSEILKAHCQSVGRNFAEITRSANVNVIIGETEKDVKERLAWLRQHYISAGVTPARVDEQVETERAGLGVGTPEQIAERLSALESLGLGYTIAYFAEAAYDTSGMHLFETRVIPDLR